MSDGAFRLLVNGIEEGMAGVALAMNLIRPGIAHAFATRLGGASRWPRVSLSFGGSSDDVADPAVRENTERLARRVGFSPGRLHRLRQVHGDRVVVVDEGSDPAQVRELEADALVTAAAGVFVAVQTADCVPLLLCDERRRVVAAAHAGWRGLVRGVIERTVEVMGDRFGSQPADLRAAVGPSIGACCFEVADDVAGQFGRWPSAVQRPRPGQRPHVDLRRVARQILTGLGCAPAAVAVTDLSTCCRSDLFFSYRCQGPDTGRHLNVIGLLG